MKHIQDSEIYSELRCEEFPFHHFFSIFVMYKQKMQKFAQMCVHCISDAILPSHPLTPFSPSALNLSQDQGLFH